MIIALDDIGDKIEKAFALRPRDIPWAELPRMREITFEYAEIDKFLHEVESFVQLYVPGKDVIDIVLRQMSPNVREYYREHYMNEYGTYDMEYQPLVKLMGTLTNVRDPEEYLEEALAKLKPGLLNPQALRVAICREIATYRRMCRRLQLEPDQATPRRVLRIYLRLLHPAIRAQLVPAMYNKEIEDIAKVEKMATEIFKAQGALAEYEREARDRKRLWESDDKAAATRKRLGREDNPNRLPLGDDDDAPPVPRSRFGNSNFRNKGNYRGNGRRVMAATLQTAPEVPAAPVNSLTVAKASIASNAPLPTANRSAATAGLTCFSCGELNHGLRDCPKFARECRSEERRVGKECRL